MKPSWIVIFFVTLLSSTVLANQDLPTTELIIEADKIYNPNELTTDSLVIYEKNFKADWRNAATVKANKEKVLEIKNFVKNYNMNDSSQLPAEHQQALGRLLYKLGTYCVHAEQTPNHAIEYFIAANALLKTRTEKIWNDTQLGYAYYQKFLLTQDDQDKEKSLRYAKSVLDHGKSVPQAVELAYNVQESLDDEVKIRPSIALFQKALNLDDNAATNFTPPFVNNKNKLATLLFALNHQQQASALSLLQRSEQFWHQQMLQENSAQNSLLTTSGQTNWQALPNSNDNQEILTTLQQAIAIYQHLFEAQDYHFMQAYVLLARLFKQMGDNDKAQSYAEHVMQLQEIDIE